MKPRTIILWSILILAFSSLGPWLRGEHFDVSSTIGGVFVFIIVAVMGTKMAKHIDSLEDRISYLEMSTGYDRRADDLGKR